MGLYTSLLIDLVNRSVSAERFFYVRPRMPSGWEASVAFITWDKTSSEGVKYRI